MLEIETRDKYKKGWVDERNRGEISFWQGQAANCVESIDVGDASGRDLFSMGNGHLSDWNDRLQPSRWAIACASCKAGGAGRTGESEETKDAQSA